MSMNSRRILVVEDERDIAQLLALHLEDLGCEVDTSYDGHTGLARALDGTAWSLLVLDLRLPGLDVHADPDADRARQRAGSSAWA